MSNHSAARPLEGLRVVEAAGFHAGPGAAATLAELGAEVIKIENPQGDPERFFKRDGVDPMKVGDNDIADPAWTVLFDFSNKGKRGIAVDLKQPEGQAVLKRLVAAADVFLTNMPTRTRAGLGTDYETLSAVNPRLVSVSVTAFGTQGPMADENGFDGLGQAMSGMMFVGVEEPGTKGLILLDHITTIVATNAILTGLVARQLHGIGQEIEVSLLGSATWAMQPNLLVASVTGAHVDTVYRRECNTTTINIYKGSDGKWLSLNKYPEPKYFAAFCEIIGAPELVNDPRFATPADRRARQAELTALVDQAFLRGTRDEWLGRFREAGFLCAPINDFFDALSDEQIVANEYVVEYDHPILGRKRLPKVPMRFSRSAQPHIEHGPLALGEKTDEVLQEHGYNIAEIDALREKGVVS